MKEKQNHVYHSFHQSAFLVVVKFIGQLWLVVKSTSLGDDKNNHYHILRVSSNGKKINIEWWGFVFEFDYYI